MSGREGRREGVREGGGRREEREREGRVEYGYLIKKEAVQFDFCDLASTNRKVYNPALERERERD